MPAVIQRLFTPEGAVLPLVQAAVRVPDLFVAEEWEWDADLDRAFVFATYEEADTYSRRLGKGAYPAIRAVAGKGTEGTEGTQRMEAPAPSPCVARGVSPAAMASGDTKARIAAAKHNPRVTAQRRTAEDWKRVYEETARRLGEHE